MLKDIERKLLRILSNFSQRHKRLPTLGGLETMLGKSKHEIIQSLGELEKQRYISWEDKTSVETIILLEVWEREGTAAKMEVIKNNTTRNTDYWTAY